jgi:hypothetical protein
VNVDELLARFDGPKKKAGDGWLVHCPAHASYRPTLSLGEGDDGRVLLHCHNGCSVDAVVAALGLTPSDLFEQDRPGAGAGPRIVATYDYLDEQGALVFQVVRYDPKAFKQRRPDGRGGWIWSTKGTRRVLYRLPQLLQAVAAGEPVYIAEGEKDVHALEAAGVTATCNSMGAGKFWAQYGKPLRGADVVIVQDRDDEGREHAAKVVAKLDGVARSVRVVEAVEGKDAADHLAAGLTVDDFRPVSAEHPERLTIGTETASLSEGAVRLGESDRPGKPPLADEPDILALLLIDLKAAGLAGEQTGAQVEFLSLTSRLLPWGKPTNRPVSTIGKGTTSTGKSYTLQTVLRFFPPEAYFDLGSMSKRFLLYTDESLAHRMIIVPEWALIAKDEELVATLRTLLSEGRLIHGTVDGDAKRTARRIEKDGPTGLLMTTTNASVDPELETRCLSFITDDTPEQTRRVYEVLAELEDEDEVAVDFARWHQLQRWIAGAGESRVVIPYVKTLAEGMPVIATRLRRDFVSLLCLIRAHALLHQAARERDELGRIVASVADYRAVHDLMDRLVAEGVEASVSAAIRETVEAVRALLPEHEVGEEPYVSVKKITDRLAIGKSATYDRVKRATAAGFLVNLAKKDERGWKVTLGADLPAGETFLPSPDELEDGVFRVSQIAPTGNENGSTMRGDDEFSGESAFPAGPPESADEPEDGLPYQGELFDEDPNEPAETDSWREQYADFGWNDDEPPPF